MGQIQDAGIIVLINILFPEVGNSIALFVYFEKQFWAELGLNRRLLLLYNYTINYLLLNKEDIKTTVPKLMEHGQRSIGP